MSSQTLPGDRYRPGSDLGTSNDNQVTISSPGIHAHENYPERVCREYVDFNSILTVSNLSRSQRSHSSSGNDGTLHPPQPHSLFWDHWTPSNTFQQIHITKLIINHDHGKK